LQQIEHTGHADDAAEDVVAERLHQVEDELRLLGLETANELIEVVANRQYGRLVAGLRKRCGDLLHDDIGLFVSGL
jgi:hypothetical protein